MYLRGGHHQLAGEVAEEMGQLETASRQYELGGLSLKAAETALKSGDRERAAQLFVKAGSTRRAAEVQEKGGKPASAAVLFEHAGDVLRAAELFLEARQPGKAARCLERILKQEPVSTQIERCRKLSERCGQIYLSQGHPEAAARWLERAGNAREAARAWERSGQSVRAIEAFLKSGEADRAAAIAESLPPEEISPTLAAEAFYSAQRWAEAASLYLESGDPSRAAHCLEQLGCSAEAAWAHQAAGDPLAAAESLERAGDQGEAAAAYHSAGAMQDAARCFEASGHLAEAAPCFMEAGERLAAARLYERIGDIEQAISVLQAIAPDDGEAYEAAQMLGRLYEAKGCDALAVDQYRRVLEGQGVDSGNIEAWYRFAGALERMAQLEEAVEVMKCVVASDISYRDAAARLRELEEAKGRRRESTLQTMPARFQVGHEIAWSGPGKAFLAEDTAMRQAVVLRRFDDEAFGSGSAAERILADVRRVGRLHHPAIAAIYDAGRDRAGVYLIQERVEGTSLRERLAGEGPLGVPETVQIITRIAEALDYAHGLGLLARVIRPETVIQTATGETRMVDFGLSIRKTDAEGPPAVYVPPEVLLGERMDPSSDIYLLGVLAWEMLFGQAPAVPAPGSRAAPEVPDRADGRLPDLLRKVISACLHPDRGLRTGTAQQLLEELHGTNLLPGALLANRYEIVQEIGRGGMGTVFAARDLVLDEPVALKVLAGNLDANTEKRFIQEIRLARQINHPNIVRLHTFERWRELRMIVMEFIDGVDLRKWAGDRSPIPLGRALEIIGGIASGLTAAHRLGIVHRDVKPENVLIDSDGRPRLVDFGIARQGDVHLTREGLVMGSPAYMSPEQIRGEAADQRADLYALGILTYFLLTGREPFDSENVADVLRMQLEEKPVALSSRREDIPRRLDDLIAQTLAKDPNQRPASLFAFLDEVNSIRAALSVVTA